MTVGNVRIRLLGGFEVAMDGESAVTQFPTRRSGELVQLLALAPGRRLTRDQAMDALWPQLDTSAGGANLRKAAHHARTALGHPSAVTLHQQHVELFPGVAVTTDVDEFLDVADAALAAGDPVGARAAALRYAGELLPGARYEPWADEQRRVLAARYLDLLRVAGQWDRVLEVDPLDEVAAREVMRAALDEGRRHHSIAVYGRLRAALSTELGVLPQPATEGLYTSCLEGLVPASPPFVGRERELATVDALARRSRQSSLVLVRGAAGIGKSSFAGALVERVRADGAAAVVVLADEPDERSQRSQQSLQSCSSACQTPRSG